MNENEGRQLLSELLSKVNASGPENFDEVPVEESAASLVAGKDDEIIELGESFDFNGFQVVRREFFAHLREPSVTFNNCSRKRTMSRCS